jgi:hypothetical protein
LKQCKRDEVNNAKDYKQAAQARRNAAARRFRQAILEHDKALKDIKHIRLIIQNSNLDHLSNKGATNTAGKQALLEIKPSVHKSLTSLVELAIKAHATGSAVDKIYDLLYQTRDSIVRSKNKLIKGEAAQIGNWRTNKLAMQDDINDLEIEYWELDKQFGATEIRIGVLLVAQSRHMLSATKNKDISNANCIKAAAKTVDCDEEQVIFNNQLATKTNEKRALQKIQKKIAALAWSHKVYKAVQNVDQGIRYLRGQYNIRSRLKRYMVAEKPNSKDVSKVFFDTVKDQSHADTYVIVLNEDDLSYCIVKKAKTGNKTYYLQEKDNNVIFQSAETYAQNVRWNFEWDKASQSMFIRNQASKNTLFVDSKNKYIVTTGKQSADSRGQFAVERPFYEEVGCYENKDSKQFKNYMGADNELNVDKCYEKCEKSGKKYTHFGLTERFQCYCGDDWNKVEAPIGECAYVCNSRTGDLCGGRFRTLVYKRLGSNAKPIIVEPRPKPSGGAVATVEKFNCYSDQVKDYQGNLGPGPDKWDHNKNMWCCQNKSILGSCKKVVPSTCKVTCKSGEHPEPPKDSTNKACAVCVKDPATTKTAVAGL